MDNRAYIQVLIETMEKKTAILKGILNQNKLQVSIAEEEKLDDSKLQATIEEKERLIQELNKADEGFDLIYARVREAILENKEFYRTEIKRLQELIKECTDLSVEITTGEERNKVKLTEVFSKGHREIKQFRQSRAVASNYYKSMSNTHVVESPFIDQKK